MSPPPDLSDQELVARARQGREEASRELLRRYQRRVYEFIYRIVREPETAEDLTQETFAKVFRALDRYRPAFPFSAWISRIANNTTVDYLRRRQLDTLSLDGSPYATTPDEMAATAMQVADRSDSTPTTPPKVDPRELRAAIEQAIRRLPGKYRRCFVLRDIEELSYEHIAEVVGLPVGTVCTYIHRARRQLKDMLGPVRDALRQRSPCTPV